MSRERITITVEPDLLAAIDATIDYTIIRNRSHALETLLRRGLALHELSTLVVNWRATPPPANAELTRRLIASLPIRHVALVASGNHAADASLWLSTLPSTITHEIVPGEFGSGAALTLLKERLSSSVAYVDPLMLTVFPTQLLGAATHHLSGTATVTSLVTAHDDGTFSPLGLWFIRNTLLADIPAGVSHLTETVFPRLARTGRVNPYVDPT